MEKEQKDLVEDVSSVTVKTTEEDNAKMASMVEQLQIRDSLRLYNELTKKCFSDCVDTFWRKSLNKQEDMCVRSCTEKFLKHTTIASLKFAEINQDASKSNYSS